MFEWGQRGETVTAVDDDLPTPLSALRDLLAATDGSGLADAELITGIDALERAKAACAAAQARLTAQFVASQAREAARLRSVAEECSVASDFDGWVAARDRARSLELPPDPARDRTGRAGALRAAQGGRGSMTPLASSHGTGSSRRRQAALVARTGVSAQVGLARHESPARGARLARVAVTLVEDLPHTLAALTAGLLSERRAELVVRGTSHLSTELRGVVDAEVIGAHLADDATSATAGVAGWSDREVERRVKACADRLDAAAAAERARVASGDRRVTIRPVPDCMAVICAVLPVETAVVVHAALQQAAASAKAEGDPRSRGQVMADTLAQRVTGQETATDVSVEVQVVITDRTLFEGDDTPAHVPGYGTVPAGWVRELLTRDLADHAHPGITSPANASRDRHDDSQPGITSPANASRDRHDDSACSGHGRSDTYRDDASGTDASAFLGCDPPAGSGSGREAPTDATPEGAARFGRQPGDVRTTRAWLRRLYTHPSTGTLVAMDSARRLFPSGLRRFLVARDGVCRTPWCSAPVRHADHVTPWAAGGPTSDTNGQGLCIACNLTKDLPGWSSLVVDRGPTAGSARPHAVEITTPTGHRYTSTAPPVLPGLLEGHDASSPEATGARGPHTPVPSAFERAVSQLLAA